MKTLHAIVSGRVQGVGFRFFVESRASTLGLKGWVRNLKGGKVEVLATGEKTELDELVASLRVGPTFSHVEETDIDWDSSPSDEVFHIRPTA